ncbi:MAG TPA: HlyD family efflux transporter periplasmic adaptor subunit [Candidatus Wallbacteria bacterium]|nr:HlyD family efflux transporter periplasmic adaptor subunit [Candidatus Wallbacteria bacterium]
MKRFLTVKSMIIIAVIAAAVYFLNPFGMNGKNTAGAVANKYAQLTVDTFEITVSCSGVVTALSSVDVKSRVGGTVEYLKLMEGDYVNKNDLVANIDKRNILLKVKQNETDLKSARAQLEKAKISYEIDRKTYATDLKRAEANAGLSFSNLKLLQKGSRPEELSQAMAQIDLARANYENSRKTFNRNKELFVKNLVSQSAMDGARAAMDVSAAQLKSAEEKYNLLKQGYQSEEIQKALAQYEVSLCAVDDAKFKIESLKIREQEIKNLESVVEKTDIIHQDALEQLKDTTVLAPISGVVTQKWVDEGGIITSGISSITAGTNIITLSDMSEIKIKANVDETDIHKLAPNLFARVKLDAFQKKVFRAKLSSIGPRVYLKDNVPVIDITLDLLEGSGEVKVGMTADAEIIITSEPDAKLIPNDSIIERGGKNFVRMANGGDNKKPEMRPIKIGLSNGEKTLLLSGLEENEQFYTGEALKAIKESNAAAKPGIPLIGGPPGARRASGGGSRNR